MNASLRRPIFRVAAAAMPLAVLAGCDSTGLSPREGASRNFSSYVNSLYDEPVAAGAKQPPARLVLPTRLAVVQVGEITPPTSFLKALRARPDVFARVEPVSGAAGAAPDGNQARDDGPAVANAHARREMDRLLQLARDMGMDHLLLVGGTIDQATKENGLSLLDLTIVGAFVVPSKQVEAEARASAALVDLSGDRVVLVASAETTRGRLASSVTQESGEIDVMREARDDVLAKLAREVVAQCTGRAAAPAPRGG